MDMPMLSGKNKMEVITGVERRRRGSAEEKLEWVRSTMEPSMTASLHDQVETNTLYWFESNPAYQFNLVNIQENGSP